MAYVPASIESTLLQVTGEARGRTAMRAGNAPCPCGRGRVAGWAVALSLLGVAPGARAQEGSGDVTEEERRLLMEALGGDEARDAGGGRDETALADVPRGGQSMNPEIALILDVAAAWFEGGESMQTGEHDPQANGFQFQALELSLGAAADPFFRVDSNLVLDGEEVHLEEAYATTMALPLRLQARAGRFLLPFGRLNPRHPHSWYFVDQAVGNGKFFGGDGSAGVGAELSWLAPLPWYVELTGTATDAGGTRTFLWVAEEEELADEEHEEEAHAHAESGHEIEGPDDLLFTVSLDQFFPFGDDWSLSLGLSAQLGPGTEAGDLRAEIYGTDFYLRYRPVNSTRRAGLTLLDEAMFRRRESGDGTLEDFANTTELVWSVSSRWEVGGRWEWISGVDGDPLDPEWTGTRTRTSAQTTFYPSHFSRLRLQAARDDAEWEDEPVLAFFLSLETLIGAHGSHEF